MFGIIPFALITFPIVYCLTFFFMCNSKELKYYSIVFLLLGNFLCTLDTNLALNFDSVSLAFLFGGLFMMIGVSLGILFIKSTKKVEEESL